VRIGEAPAVADADAVPAACCPYEVKTLVHGMIVISALPGRQIQALRGPRSRPKGKASSSGTRLIVRQLCSDTRFTRSQIAASAGFP